MLWIPQAAAATCVHININTGTTDTHQSLGADTLVDVIALPIVEGNA